MNTINVVVAKKNTIKVSTNATSTAVVTSNPVTIKPTANFQSVSGAEELSQLKDVDVSQEQDGSVLQFNAATDMYQSKTLVIDGGEF
jgi:hypothetical protein